jgi:hypothetical protein
VSDNEAQQETTMRVASKQKMVDTDTKRDQSMMQLPAALLLDSVGDGSSSGSCARDGRKIIKESSARKNSLDTQIHIKKETKQNGIKM